MFPLTSQSLSCMTGGRRHRALAAKVPSGWAYLFLNPRPKSSAVSLSRLTASYSVQTPAKCSVSIHVAYAENPMTSTLSLINQCNPHISTKLCIYQCKSLQTMRLELLLYWSDFKQQMARTWSSNINSVPFLTAWSKDTAMASRVTLPPPETEKARAHPSAPTGDVTDTDIYGRWDSI